MAPDGLEARLALLNARRRREYSTGRKVSAAQMKQVKLQPNTFHGEWNYLILPSRST